MHAITEGTNAQADMTPEEECYYAEINGLANGTGINMLAVFPGIRD